MLAFVAILWTNAGIADSAEAGASPLFFVLLCVFSYFLHNNELLEVPIVQLFQDQIH